MKTLINILFRYSEDNPDFIAYHYPYIKYDCNLCIITDMNYEQIIMSIIILFSPFY